MSANRDNKARIPVTIRKGDQVRVMVGRDAGKTGRVLSVNAVSRKVTVEHAQMIKRHTRPNPQKNIKGGIVEREAPLDLSSVMLVCPACGKHTRIGHQVDFDPATRRVTRKFRVCKRCGATVDK